MITKTKCNRGYTFTDLQIEPLGDSALTAYFGNGISLEISSSALHLQELILNKQYRGITGTVPAYASLTIHFDPEIWSFVNLKNQLLNEVIKNHTEPFRPGKLVEIPVRYGGEEGPDLIEISRMLSLPLEEIIQRHAQRAYRVYFIGFQPGFPYLGGMDTTLAAPRWPIPRTSVPAGSVGIAGEQTGIYPHESPGGWRIIGRTDIRLFDIDRDPPALLKAGDSVRFVPVNDLTKK